MAKFKPLPPLAELQEAFDYDQETGYLLRKVSSTQTHRIGKPAGSKDRKGYIRVKLYGKSFAAHRIIWYLCTGTDPLELEVDHIDRCKANNCFENLRLVTHLQNGQNVPAKGCWYSVREKKYKAAIRFNGSLFCLGTFPTCREAERAYREKAVELRGEFTPQEWL